MKANTVLISFIDDLISYIDGKFLADENIEATQKPRGKSAFNTNLIRSATKPFYVVRCLSDAPQDETFVKVATLELNIQIDIYALKGLYNKEEYLAEPMSMILQNVVSNYMLDLKYSGENKNICLLREITASPALPFEDGSKAYQSSLRYNIVVMRDYE